MAFDDLIKGIAVFNQGVTEYAVSRAANDAHEQMNALNSQEMDRKQRLEAQSQIGNDLALRLQSAGANPADIAATANRLSVSGGEQAQILAAEDQTNLTQKFKHAENEQLHAHQIELQQMKLDALQGKEGKAQQKLMLGFGKELDKKPDFKPMLDSMPKLVDALEKIKESKGKMGATAMINLAQLGLIRGAAGRVNEKEIEGANESQSKRAQLWKRMGLEATGEVPMNIQTFWEKVHQRGVDNLKIHMKDHIRGFAKEKSQLSDGDIDEEKLSNALLNRYNLGDASSSPVTAKETSVLAPPSPAKSPLNKYLTPMGN